MRSVMELDDMPAVLPLEALIQESLHKELSMEEMIVSWLSLMSIV